MYAEKQEFCRSKVHCWTDELAKLNSSFTRVAGQSLPSAPISYPIPQDTLIKWKRLARDKSFMCNQAAGLSRCLTKVQDYMSTHLKVIQGDTAKGKSAYKNQEAAEEQGYLMTFMRSITQAMVRNMQDLSEGIFINMANLTLTHRGSYMDHLKQETLFILRNS